MPRSLSVTRTVTNKGQITLPIAWCRKKGITPGDKFIVSVDEEGQIVITHLKKMKPNKKRVPG